MNRYLIHRTLRGAGQLSPDELTAIAQKSNEVLAGMAPRVQWVESFVTADGIVCQYLAEDEAAVREHARHGGFPCDDVQLVASMFGPMTAEA